MIFMKKAYFVFLLILIFSLRIEAQNVGIGTDNPTTKLDVSGNFKVSAVYTAAVNQPTAAQTITLVNAVTSTISSVDSTARIYDPGGSGAHYPANVATGFLAVNNSVLGSYIELFIELIELGTGDSLKIYDGNDGTSPLLYEVGNGFSGNNITLNLSGNVLYCTFKSNADASVGAGFSLQLKRKFISNNASEQGISTGAAVVFYSKEAAFRTGILKNSSIGLVSFASGTNTIASGNSATSFGSGTLASGDNSTAFGNQTIASGRGAVAMGGNGFTGSSFVNSNAIGTNSVAMGGGCYATQTNSVAMGTSTIASGYSSIAIGSLGVKGAIYSQTTAAGTNSVAIGYGTVASGSYSLAIGAVNQAAGMFSTSIGYNTAAEGNYSTSMCYGTTASGSYSTAMGYNTTSSGDYSTAMGKNVRVTGEGSFAIGDNTSTSAVYAGQNVMHMRFSNGYRFYTTGNHSTGVSMGAGANSWSIISDIRKKEFYKPADGKTFLQKISSMQLGSWNYIGQDKNTYRHYGPMAQEFYKHFGNDGVGSIGNDTTIASADIDGVMMIAIQALVKENEVLKKENEKLENRLKKVEAILLKQE
ncbi:MAG: hypothetical protein EOP47_12230 [Sphingobacteriaceae bacterium]|nr:MAG: hypothetical protein EOP47_12230 [Sphingobacteriaceae bacterium]